MLRMHRRERALAQHAAQAHALGLGIVLAEQARLQPIEAFELFGGRKLRMVGNVVGDTDES